MTMEERAKAAAEEMYNTVHGCNVFMCDVCGPNRPIPCRFGGAWPNPDKQKAVYEAIILRHMRGEEREGE